MNPKPSAAAFQCAPVNSGALKCTQPYIGVEEVATMLATSVPAIYALIARREIPHFRLGRRVLFDPAEVHAWVDAHRVDPLNLEDFRNRPEKLPSAPGVCKPSGADRPIGGTHERDAA